MTRFRKRRDHAPAATTRHRRRWAIYTLVMLAGFPLPEMASARSAKKSSGGGDARIRALEGALRQTQEELKSLKGRVEQQRAIGQATAKETQEAADAAKVATETAKKGASLPDWLSKTSLYGDVRYRHEGYYHAPHQAKTVSTARNRERVRARIGVKFTYSDELSANIRVATGNINDPISTNDTLTGGFSRKNINLDLASLTFTPGKSFGIRPGVASITLGKFNTPFFRVGELVFDEDVAGEGAAQTFQLLGSPLGPVDQIKLHAIEWTFAEVANKVDGWVFGGQINPTAKIGNVQLEAGIGQYYWSNPDLIAQLLSRNTTSYTATGAAVANSNFNSSLTNTNLLTTRYIQPPTPKGGKRPTPFTAITGYQSGFNQTNALLSATIPNVVAQQPLRVWFDYVHNWEAVTDDSDGYQVGVRLGQVKNKGDWSVFGFYQHLEQEAVISSFTSSEFGTAGTNVEGPGVGVDYQLLGPITLSAKGYFTNYLRRPAGSNNSTLSRVQLDALLRF